MHKIKCLCNKCNGHLIPDKSLEKKGRVNLLKCTKCKCSYSLFRGYRTTKCSKKDNQQLITRNRKPRSARRNRKRKKK